MPQFFVWRHLANRRKTCVLSISVFRPCKVHVCGRAQLNDSTATQPKEPSSCRLTLQDSQRTSWPEVSPPPSRRPPSPPLNVWNSCSKSRQLQSKSPPTSSTKVGDMWHESTIFNWARGFWGWKGRFWKGLWVLGCIGCCGGCGVEVWAGF